MASIGFCNIEECSRRQGIEKLCASSSSYCRFVELRIASKAIAQLRVRQFTGGDFSS